MTAMAIQGPGCGAQREVSAICRARFVIAKLGRTIHNLMVFIDKNRGWRWQRVPRSAGRCEQYRQDFNAEKERRTTEGHGGLFACFALMNPSPWPSVALRSSSVSKSFLPGADANLACGAPSGVDR